MKLGEQIIMTLRVRIAENVVTVRGQRSRSQRGQMHFSTEG